MIDHHLKESKTKQLFSDCSSSLAIFARDQIRGFVDRGKCIQDRGLFRATNQRLVLVSRTNWPGIHGEHGWALYSYSLALYPGPMKMPGTTYHKSMIFKRLTAIDFFRRDLSHHRRHRFNKSAVNQRLLPPKRMTFRKVVTRRVLLDWNCIKTNS